MNTQTPMRTGNAMPNRMLNVDWADDAVSVSVPGGMCGPTRVK